MMFALTVVMLTNGQPHSLSSQKEFSSKVECAKVAKGFIHELQPFNKTGSTFTFSCKSYFPE